MLHENIFLFQLLKVFLILHAYTTVCARPLIHNVGVVTAAVEMTFMPKTDSVVSFFTFMPCTESKINALIYSANSKLCLNYDV